MKAYTDYPIERLGDAPYAKAPIRPCTVLSFDGDKYCRVEVGGVVEEIKIGYLYKERGRCGCVPQIDGEQIGRGKTT